jgi:SNF2 family DNA or RNA helicase
VESQCADGEIEFRKLYGVFGGISKMDDEKLNDAVVAYQKDLANVVYPNGMQLKDYHVYGVSWMMTNYLNGRSSLVADEMGLGYV